MEAPVEWDSINSFNTKPYEAGLCYYGDLHFSDEILRHQGVHHLTYGHTARE